MGEPFISKRRHLGIKVEATKGTYSAPGSGDFAIHAFDIQCSTQFGRFDRDTQKAYLSKLPGIVGTTAATISFKCEVRHTANTTTLDVWERALQGCGFELNTSTLQPTSNSDEQKTLSIAVALGAFGDGASEAVIFSAAGCVGNVVFSGKVGEPMFATFTFTGVYNTTATGTLEVPTQEAGIPQVFQGVTFTYGGTARVISSLTVDIGNSVVLRETVNNTSGLLHAQIVDRRTTGSVDPDLELVATEDFYGQLAANTTKALGWVLNTSGGETQTFAIADIRVTNVNDTNRNGIQVAGLDFEVVDTLDSTTPDGDFTITLS